MKFRPGNASPQTGIEEMIRHTLGLVEETGRFLQHFRSDSAGYQSDVIDLLDGEGAGYTITADLDEAVRRVIKAIPEAGWDVFRDRDGFQTGREVSETVHTMNDSGHAFRLVAWREQVEDPSLFATPDEDFYRYRAVIINVSEKEMSVEEVLPSGWTCQTIQTLRQKALRLVGKVTKSARQLTLKIRTSADQLSQLRTARRLIYHLD